MLRRQEGSAITLQTSFFDDNSITTAPTTVRYKLTCNTTGQPILAWTDLTPDTSIEILITADQNAIINRNNPIERKVLSIEADNGLDTAYSDEYEYEIKRLT